jgi:hypothetical protein
MNALKWIVKEAKSLRRKYPKRYTGKNAWRKYMAQASAIYASKHKGKSPVGRKKKISGTARKAHHKKKHTHWGGVKRHRRRVSGVSTVSRTHTDKNIIPTSIQIGKASEGQLKKEIRRRKTEKANKLIVKRHYEKSKVKRRGYTRKISELKKELQLLS